jgi:sterol desaturase/sphingolipid hydroxylase (fatty acid hydroxylase superfamily)
MKNIGAIFADDRGTASVGYGLTAAVIFLLTLFGISGAGYDVDMLTSGFEDAAATAQNMASFATERATELIVTVAGPSSRLFPLYLIVTLGVCAFLYRRRKVSTSFLAWLVPKSIYLHASHIVDLKVFLVNRLVTAFGFFNLVLFNSWIAVTIADSFSLGSGLGTLSPILIAILLLMASDFSTYWVHRIHHENRIIWPFHSLHHSAEVMTPVTAYRKHPVYDLISSLVRGVLVGVSQGVLLVLLQQDPSLITIASINTFYVLFNLAGSNLRHSHVWLSFGSVIEHVFISPAQHQIHHSIDPRHHNKNYGEVLAIWDWMFGTLYIPRQLEEIEFGLGDKNGARLRQRHDSLSAAMVVPVVDSWAQLRKRFSRSKPAATPRRTRS